MNFEEYLITKKIDSILFKEAEPERWKEWNTIFIELSPASFTAQKLYLINPIRRKYPLRSIPETQRQDNISEPKNLEQKQASPKPAFRPKIK